MRSRGLTMPDIAPARSLATRVEQLDAELDAGIEATKAERAIADAAPDGPRATARKRSQVERSWFWDDETQVAHYLAGAEGKREAYAGQTIRVVESAPGAFGRQLERARDGIGAVWGGRTSYDPSSHGSAHRAAAHDVWQTLARSERIVLSAMFGDLLEPGDRGPRSVAAKVREFMREGAVASAHALLGAPPFRGVDLEAVTPTQLAAIQLGRLSASADADTKAGVTSELSIELRAARRTFRDRLRGVDVNACLDRMADAAGLARDRRPYLIPPASLAELEAQRAREERVCIGPIDLDPIDPSVDVLLAIAAGDRPHCGSSLVVADVSSWPRCDACHLPKRVARHEDRYDP